MCHFIAACSGTPVSSFINCKSGEDSSRTKVLFLTLNCRRVDFLAAKEIFLTAITASDRVLSQKPLDI